VAEGWVVSFITGGSFIALGPDLVRYFRPNEIENEISSY
jgi:hypothetical protein